MSDFDPDKFISGAYDTKPKQAAKEAFDPDAFISGKYDTKRPSKKDGSGSSEAQTALENYGDTLTMGYLPQLQSVAEKVMTPILNAVTGNDVTADDYLKARDENRKRIERLSAENPKSAIIGKALGIINQAPLLAGKAVQGASALSKIANAAKLGAVYGAAQNPGDIEGELSPVQIADRAKNAAIGATTGAVVQGGLEAIPALKKAASNSAAYFGDLADEKAAKVLGHLSKFEKAADKGTAKQIGRVLRDEGAIKPWTTTGSAANAVEKVREEAGQEIGKIIENANPGTNIDTKKIAEAIRSSETLREMANTPGMETAYTKINGMLDTLAKNGNVDLKQAHKLRQMVDRGINFARRGESPIPEEGLKAIRTTIRDTMNDAVNASDEIAGIGGKDRLLAANKKYSLMSEAADIADQQLARNAKNRTISLTDTISGAAGAATGGPIAGIATGLANKGVRTFGNSTASYALGLAEKTLLKIPKFASLAERDPQLFNSIVQRVGLRSRQGSFESLPDQIDKLYLSAQNDQTDESSRESPGSPKKGEDLWVQRGVEKLGIEDSNLANKVLQSKEGRRLLIEASDLPEGSDRLKIIQDKINQGWGKQYGSELRSGDPAEILRQQRKPSGRR